MSMITLLAECVALVVTTEECKDRVSDNGYFCVLDPS